MVTSATSKNGNTSSQHTSDSLTPSFHNCYNKQKDQQTPSQTHYSEQEQTPLRKEKHGSGWATGLPFILVNITKGPAATVCRQMGLASNGLETWRQLAIRFSIPVGTRSIRYLTKLLKPSFDESKFEEAFANMGI